jgi:hypothetical protein
MFPTKCDTEVPVTDSDPNRPKHSGVGRKQPSRSSTPVAARNSRHETWDDWDGGLDPHGDWPEEG